MVNWRNRPTDKIYSQLKPWKYYPKPSFPPTEDNVASWENRFCTSCWKVVDTKKKFCFYCNVINWDDSAAEEALHNAKKRFWAEINNIHCNISLPDPDAYIDEMDWNPVIDPELIKELDREYVPSDDEQQNDKVGETNKKTISLVSKNDHGNPWDECHDYMQVDEAFQSRKNQWNNFIDNSNILDNHWESIDIRRNEHVEGNVDANAWNGGYHDFVSTNDREWNDSWNQQKSKNIETDNNLSGHSSGQDNGVPKRDGGGGGGGGGGVLERSGSLEQP